MTAWQKFLKQCIPSRKERRELQMFMGWALAGCARLKPSQPDQHPLKTKRGARA